MSETTEQKKFAHSEEGRQRDVCETDNTWYAASLLTIGGELSGWDTDESGNTTFIITNIPVKYEKAYLDWMDGKVVGNLKKFKDSYHDLVDLALQERNKTERRGS